MTLSNRIVRDRGTRSAAPERGALPGRGLRDTLHVCQVIASINRDTGGPAVTVTKLSSALVKSGQVDCQLITLDYAALGPQVTPGGAEVVSLPAGFLARYLRGWSRRLRLRLEQQAIGSDLIHNHGLWMFPNLYARQAALHANIPLVISPRGMLDEWSLGRSRTKKFLVWHLFERANLRAARLLHATSPDEARSLRRVGLRQPITIIPNGVDIPDPDIFPNRHLLEQKYAELIGRRWLLFLSRLHPKKGVSELLTAWQQQAGEFPNWQLIIAGPDLNGHADMVRDQAKTFGIDKRVTFTGMLAGPEKQAALANSEIFVLPTHSENFGVAIAEALAFGLPVITTKGAPWRDLETHHCGWWIDLDPATLTATLGMAMETSAEALQEMGARGRALMAQKYSWQRVGEQMKQSYEWLLGRSDRPGFVELIN